MTPVHPPRVCLALALMLVCLLASPAFAAKTDKVTLINGDTLTCEVKTLSRGRLTVDTDNLSTVSIEWDKVATIEAKRPFQVETSSGLRGVGQLVSPSAGHVDVIGATRTLSLELIEIVTIAEIGSNFWNRLDGSFDFGLSYTQSSGVAQMSLNSNVVFRRPSFEMNLTGSSYFTRQPDTEDSSRHDLGLNYQRPFGTYWVAFGSGGFEKNRDLGYDLRSTVSAGVGRLFINSNRAKLGIGSGLSTNRELPVDGEAVQNYDLLFSFQQSFFTYDFPKTEVSNSLSAYPGLSQWGRFRLQFDSKIKREIVHDFTVGLTLYDSYDNRPPTAEARKNDVGFTFNVGWTF